MLAMNGGLRRSFVFAKWSTIYLQKAGSVYDLVAKI
jgi:hypothetical protein